jgi:hemolysin activation/secretion protein
MSETEDYSGPTASLRIHLLWISVFVSFLLVNTSVPAHSEEVMLDDADVVDTDIAPAREAGVGGEVSRDALEAARAAEAAARSAEQRAGSLATKPMPAIGKVARPAPPPTIMLRDIRFTASSYLEEDELAALEAELVGRRYRLDQLQVVAAAVTALYTKKNIALAQANITAVDPAGGFIEIELFEARIGQVGYSGGNLSDSYLDFRLGLKSGDLADNRRINRVLSRLALTDGLQVNANFNPGAERGQTNLNIALPDRNPVQASLSTDNYGTKASGQSRLNGSVVVNSLTGWNDPLAVSGTVREHAWNAFGSYSRVIHPDGSALTLSGSYSDAIAKGFVDLNEVAWSTSLGLSVPLVVEQTFRFSLTASAQYFESNTTLGGLDVLDQSGYAVETGFSFLRQGQSSNGRGWSIGVAAAVAFGVYDDPVFSISGADFTSISGNFNVAVGLNPDWLVSMSGSGRHSLKGATPSAYDFTVTSPFGVRGYPVSLSSGDSGYWVRFQLERATSLPGLPEDVQLRPFAFADFGEAFEQAGGLITGQGRANSVGIGLTMQLQEFLSADIYAAKPLTDVAGFDAGNENGVVRGNLTFRF